MIRKHEAITSRFEKPLINRLCRMMPAWVHSDMLTALGVGGAAVACIGYWQSAANANWLWVAIAGISINWLGDSLDGSLARFRSVERPNYGFFIDHLTDTLAMGLIAVGIGLSPYANLTCALVVLLAYYLMIILSMATCLVTGVLQISFNGCGPTEIRLFLIACTLAAIALPTGEVIITGRVFTVYDVVMLAVAALMLAMFAAQAITTAQALAAKEPRRK